MRKELEQLDRLDTPDDWMQIEDRVPRRRPEPTSIPRRRRVGAGLVAVAVSAATVVWLVTAMRGSNPPVSVSSAGTPPMVASLEYRGGSRLALLQQPDAEPRWLTGVSGTMTDPFPARDVAISPDGRSIAFVGFVHATNWIYAGALDDPSTWRPIPGTTGGEHPAWSPDGTQLAFSVGSSIFTIDRDGSNLRKLTRGLDPTWSPDGKAIAFTALGGGISMYALSDGTVTRLTNGADAGAAFSPDGTEVAYIHTGSGRTAITVLPVTGGQPLALAECPRACNAPLWEPSGHTIAFISGGAFAQVSIEAPSVTTTLLAGRDVGSFGWATSQSTASAERCHGDQLTAREIVTDGAGGNVRTPIELVNRSAEPCELSGYPELRFLDVAGDDLRLHAETSPNDTGTVPPSPIPRAPFVLEPGAKAWLVVSFSDVQPPCTRVFGVAITPPGGTGTVTMHVDPAHEWDVCQGHLTYTAASTVHPGI